MSYESLYNLSDSSADPGYFERFPSRDASLTRLREGKPFDVVVAGGGIHGASFARLAAFNGLRTLLVEMGDYAGETSSRSSKMAHGGLRYLEMFDLQQVFEGIKAREDLFECAGNLVKPYDFLIPVHSVWERWKFEIGLSLYDRFVRAPGRKHQWIPKGSLPEDIFPRDSGTLRGCLRYCDGVMDDARLVVENIVSARQEGAYCLNHVRLDSVAHRAEGIVEVGVTDVLTGEKFEVTTGIVVNCAGPWAPTVGRVGAASGPRRVRYSQGTHLIFSKPWNRPALFLPLPEKGRYYFIWPHFAGTMVGTTEREVNGLVVDPQPTQEEIREILARLERDVPHLGLDRSTLHYAFAGVRTLPIRQDTSRTSALSRKHIWSYGQGMLTLLGGKLTTASWTSYEGLKTAWELGRLPGKPTSLEGRKFPCDLFPDEVYRFDEEARKRGVSPQLRSAALRRFGARVRHLLDHDESDLEPVGGIVLRGELRMAVSVEQAATFEDLYRRRLLLEYERGHGLEGAAAVCEALETIAPHVDWEAGLVKYRERLERLNSLLRV